MSVWVSVCAGVCDGLRECVPDVHVCVGVFVCAPFVCLFVYVCVYDRTSLCVCVLGPLCLCVCVCAWISVCVHIQCRCVRGGIGLLLLEVNDRDLFAGGAEQPALPRQVHDLQRLQRPR
jgi:hypothetical protein